MESNDPIKFKFSKKATKIDEILAVDLTLCVTNIYVFGGSSRVSLMTWICLHFCFQLDKWKLKYFE